MAHNLRRIALLLVLSLSAAATLHAQGPLQLDRVPANPDLRATTQLPGHMPPWAISAQDRGSIAAGTRIDHAIVLLSRAPAVEAAFQQFLVDVQNPASPQYHQWLTPEQVGALYGPTQHDVDAVSAWLTAQGLQVEGVHPSKIFITFSGDSSSVQQAFATEIHNFSTSDPRHPIQFAVTSEPSVPSALAPVIQSVVGLSQNFHHPYLHQQTAPLAAVLHPKGTASLGSASPSAVSPNVALSGGTNWILPSDFATLYDINSVYNSGITGSTKYSVAIIGASEITPADITNYKSIAGLPSKQPNEIVVPPYTNPGMTGNGSGGAGDADQGEATLDVDRVLGTAPGANADLLLIPSLLDTSILAAINYETGTQKDAVLSMSFGSCEVDAGTKASTATPFDNAYTVGTAEGISMFVSSGDSEATGCASAGGTYTQNAGYLTPSTNVLCTPNITCVGGTEFNDSPAATYWATSNSGTDAGGKDSTALSYIPEGVWNEPISSGTTTSYVILGGGGGPSIFWTTKPTWQTGTGVPADGVRDTPDISFSASSHNAYLACTTYNNDTCTTYVTGFSGTSAAAPSMAAIAALVDQKLGALQGSYNPLLYKIAASTPAAIHDATPTSSGVSPCVLTTASLCNSSTPGPSGLTGGVAGYALTTGYDLATGLGSLDVANFITAAVAATTTAATTNTLTPLTSSITTSQSVTFTSTITSSTAGTPTGTVQFAVGGVNNGTPVTLSSAKAQTTIVFPSTGTFSVTAVYSGDSNYAASTGTASVTVTAPVLPATTNTLTGTTGTISTQQTASYTATITSGTAGTPTGTVQFYKGTTALGSPVTLSGAKASLSGLSLGAGTFSITAVYSGDTNYAASTSNALSVTVNTVPTSISVTPANATITTVQTQVFTATLVNSSGTGTPTGTVQFSVDGVAKGSAVPLSGLTATSAAFSFSSGNHVITATYSGDSVFAVSASPSVLIAVNYATSGITETVNPTSITTAGTSTVTFTVSGAGATPTGTVAFHGPSGTSTLTLVNGTVSTTISGAAIGTYGLYGVYSGDSIYATSTSTTTNLIVTAAPTFTLAPSPATLSIAPGAATGNTSTITFTSLYTFAGSVTPTCVVAYTGTGSGSDTPTCGFSPTPVTLASGGTGTTVLTLSSTAPSVRSGTGLASNSTGKALGGLAFSALLLLLIPATRRRALRQWRGLALLLLASATLLAASGCGSGGSSGSGGNSNPGTTAGSYTVTITGTSGSTSAQTTIALTIL